MQRHGTLSMDWTDRCPSNRYQALLFQQLLKVNHAFAFKPITIKFSKSANFWMLFQMTCPIFNSIDFEHLYQEKYVHTQSPARSEQGQLLLNMLLG